MSILGKDNMTFKEKVLYDTRNYKEGDHWRFQHQAHTYAKLSMEYPIFLENMFDLCAEGYFEPIQEGSVFHFKILKK